MSSSKGGPDSSDPQADVAWEQAWRSARLPRDSVDNIAHDRVPNTSASRHNRALGETRVDGTPPALAKASRPSMLPMPEEPPPIEVELVRDERVFGRSEDGSVEVHDWAIIEIWTRNRIYLLNSQMLCIEVISRESGKPDQAHALLGSTCVGGIRQYHSSMHMSHPLPIPGTEASFRVPPRDPKRSRGHKSVNTTKVERVILRVLLASVARSVDADFSDVTSVHLRPRR